MARKKRPKPRPRRMSSILGGLGSRECFATEEGWQEYQDMLAKLKMRALEQITDGEEIRPSEGFRKRQPNRRQPSKRRISYDRQAKSA